MSSKEKILPFGRLGMTRRGLRKNRGKRETSLPFLEIVLRDNHPLGSPRRLKWMNKCPDPHLLSVGAVKETIGTDTAPTKKIKREPFTMFSKMKPWRIWAVEFQGSMHPWTTSKLNFNRT